MDDSRKAQLLSLLSGMGIGAADTTALMCYDRALTHSSAGDDDNERMEFLGDCILDYLIGEELYKSFDQRSENLRKRFPTLKDEALLTDMLHEITNDRNLASIAGKIPGFDDAIRRGMGQHVTTSIRAGTIEALITAIYLHQGIDHTRNIVLNLFRESIERAEPIVSWKNRLQEYIQKRTKVADVKETIQYRTSRMAGTPDHDARHYSEVYVRLSGKDWELWGSGSGRQGIDAEMDAAETAYSGHCSASHR